MKMRESLNKAMPIEHSRLVNVYHQVVSNVREARSVQSVLEKEHQMRWLMRYMRSADRAKP